MKDKGKVEMINRFMKPAMVENIPTHENRSARPLEMYKNEQFYADGYDIDEDNDEIARMFGVIEL